MKNDKPGNRPTTASASAKSNQPAQKTPTIEEVIADNERWYRANRNREVYEAIYGAPGEFPAMEY